MRSVLSSDGKSRTCRAGLPARAVGRTADHRTAPVTGSKTSNKPGRAASMRRDPSTMRTLSAGSPPSSGFSHTVWPRSISTPASAASVDTRSAPAGVTCCQRMSPFILRVHAGVAPDGAGAAVCACAAVGPATRSVSESRARRAETADMAILRWPPISPQGEPQRKSRDALLAFPRLADRLELRERSAAGALRRCPERSLHSGARGGRRRDGHRLPCPRSEARSRRRDRSEEHTSELQSHSDLVCRLLLEKKKRKQATQHRKAISVVAHH